ncbi:MAG: DUF1800 family protein [Niabella sp.]
MSVSNQLKNQHLLWRAGFGPAAEQLNELAAYTPAQYYKAIVKASNKKPAYINVTNEALRNVYDGLMNNKERAKLTAVERQEIGRMQRQAVRDLNIYWLKEMVATPAQLREKMAFFWHGHFACRNQNIFYNQLLLHSIREHALSDFGTILREVSHAAAMLNFLNNQQNRKGRPNENFAREVMELFTLGRGNYTEQDIKEAARAFTGWTANARGEFVFRKNTHDDDVKHFMGKSGNFNGDDILQILLDNKQTAYYITRKIYSFFVNRKIDEEIVKSLAERFYKSRYSISKLMEDIFTADWFYDEKNIGAQIKSPIELLAGIQRAVPMQLDNDAALLNLQKLLGQQLLYPPNVAGWPGGTSWIDSSTLMTRMRIPQMFTDRDELNIIPKADDDQMMGRKDDGSAAIPNINKKKKGYIINAKIDWLPYISKYEKVKRTELLLAIKQNLLQVNTPGLENAMGKTLDASSRESYIKTATIQLMSTPEYQMC